MTYRSRVALFLAALLALTACGPNVRGIALQDVPGGDESRGQAAIAAHGCGSCHIIPGIPGAQGLVGPPPTGFAPKMHRWGAPQLPRQPDRLAARPASPRTRHDHAHPRPHRSRGPQPRRLSGNAALSDWPARTSGRAAKLAAWGTRRSGSSPSAQGFRPLRMRIEYVPTISFRGPMRLLIEWDASVTS